jgi:hypothetical protein
VQVDAVLRELGRAEAGLASKTREPVLTSPQFIQQYFSSFCEDPIMREIEKVVTLFVLSGSAGSVGIREFNSEKAQLCIKKTP